MAKSGKTTARSNGKHPGGRPTEYKPSYCTTAIEFLAKGYSVAGLAGHLKVSRQTLYNWADAVPEFLDALSIGKARSAEWWESRAIEMGCGLNKDAAPSIVIFGLKNRVADDWRDKHDIDHSGEIDVNVSYHRQKTDEQIKNRVSALRIGQNGLSQSTS